MPTNTYDLVVLGDEPAGLIAATLVARRGLRVLLLVSGEPESYELGPYSLPRRALPMVGLESPAIRRVLEELHFQNPLRRRLGRDEPSFQLATPRARIDVRPDDESLARELARESAEAAAVLQSCTAAAQVSAELAPILGQDIAIPATGFFEKREISRVEEQLGESADRIWQGAATDPLTRVLLGAPAALATGAGASGSALSRLRAFDTWRRGAPRLRGDWRTLREMFLEKLDSHGGDVRIGTAAELSFAWGGKVSGVVLDDGEAIGSGHVLCALPIAELEALCGKHAKKVRPIAESIDLGGHRYVLNLIADEAGIPAGMSHTVMLVRDPEAELTGANAVLVHVSEPDDVARVAVTASCVCPLDPGRSQDRAFADLRASLRATLEEFMPFLEGHVRVAHSPNERLPAEGITPEMGLDEPLPAEAVWMVRGSGALGLAGVPYQVGLKNLTMCNSQILPGLGLEADFHVGWQAARLALGSGSKKKDYLGGSVLAAGE